MLVVLALITIIIGMGVPATNRFVASARLKGATREVAGLVQLARSAAITERASHTLHFDETAHRISITNDATQTTLEAQRMLPQAIAWTLTEGADGSGAPVETMTFVSSGALQGRAVTIQLRDASGIASRLIVNKATGLVKIE